MYTNNSTKIKDKINDKFLSRDINPISSKDYYQEIDNNVIVAKTKNAIQVLENSQLQKVNTFNSYIDCENHLSLYKI